MNPFTAYWITTIGIIAISLGVGGMIGYAIGLKQGVRLVLDIESDYDEDDILESQEVS